MPSVGDPAKVHTCGPPQVLTVQGHLHNRPRGLRDGCRTHACCHRSSQPGGLERVHSEVHRCQLQNIWSHTCSVCYTISNDCSRAHVKCSANEVIIYDTKDLKAKRAVMRGDYTTDLVCFVPQPASG